MAPFLTGGCTAKTRNPLYKISVYLFVSPLSLSLSLSLSLLNTNAVRSRYYWRDQEDGSWHVLCNSKDCPSHPPEPPDPKPSYPYFCNGHGMHAFSQTGAVGTWHWQVEEPAYNNSVTMVNGTTVQIGRR
jgi:hypothetical protein